MKLATFIGEQLTPAFYADPERLFPWTWKRTNNRQRARTHGLTDGREAKDGNGSYIRENTPFLIYDGTDTSAREEFVKLYQNRNNIPTREEAAHAIADIYGITFPQIDHSEKADEADYRWSANASWIRDLRQLIATPDDTEEWAYLTTADKDDPDKGRGLTPDAIREAGIGIVRNKEQAFIVNEIIGKNRWKPVGGIGTTYRIFVPIIAAGRLIGIQFRILPRVADEQGITRRYHTAGSTAIPFGLRMPSLKDKSRAATLVVTEGIYDAIAADMALQNIAVGVAAVMGSCVTAEQAAAIKAAGYEWVYFVPDYDGIEKYPNRKESIDATRDALKAVGVRTYVVDMEDDDATRKSDPNTFVIRHGTQAFADRVTEASSVTAYKVNHLGMEFGMPLKDWDGLSLHDKRQYSHAAAAYIAEEDDPLEFRYIMEQKEIIEPLFGDADKAREAISAVREEIAENNRRKQAEKLLETAQALIREGKWERAIPMIDEAKRLQHGGEAAQLYAEWSMPRSWDEMIAEYTRQGGGIRTGLMMSLHNDDDSTETILYGGSLSVIAAPTGHGKTKMLHNFLLLALQAEMAAATGRQVWLFHYEESHGDVLNSLINILSNNKDGKRNKSYIREVMHTGHTVIEPIEEAMAKIRGYYERGVIQIISSHPTIEKIRAGVMEASRRGILAAVFLDYIQKIETERKTSGKKEQVAAVCNTLNELATDTGLPIVAGAQFNRAPLSPVDMELQQLADASEIEQSAALVIGGYSSSFDVRAGSSWNDSKEAEKVSEAKWIPKNGKTMYLRVLKDREGRENVWGVFTWDGNTGRLGDNKITL